MLLKETPKFNDLDLFPILENTSKFSSTILIPIVEDKEMGTFQINLNDLVSFAENNSILDLGQSLYQICSDHQIDPNKVCFVVNEDSLISNEHLQDFVMNMLENNLMVGVSFHVLNETNIDYRHGELTDDPRSDNIRMTQIADDIFNTLKLAANSKDTEEDRENLNVRKGIGKWFDLDIARQAANRHFIKGKGVKYTGDLIGPQGQTLGFNANSFKQAREAAKNMQAQIDKAKNIDLDQYEGKDKNNKAVLKYGAKYAGPFLMKLYHILIDQMENGVIQQEEKIRDLKRSIEEMNIPKNFISRMIAKLRVLYYRFMIRFNLGIYDREYNTKNTQLLVKTINAGFQNLNKDFFKASFKDKVEKLKPILKNAGQLGLNAFKMKLITIAGRIANVIDALLSYLQKTADKFSS